MPRTSAISELFHLTRTLPTVHQEYCKILLVNYYGKLYQFLLKHFKSYTEYEYKAYLNSVVRCYSGQAKRICLLADNVKVIIHRVTVLYQRPLRAAEIQR